jgi:hypothetical protein
MTNLGVASLMRGDAAEAARLLEQTLAAMPRSIGHYGQAVSRIFVAWAAIMQGDHQRAARCLRDAMPYLGSFRHMNHVLLIAALLTPAGERPDDAVRLFAAAESAAGRAGGLPNPGTWTVVIREERLRVLRATLDEGTFAAVWAEGQALSGDDALALALRSLEAADGSGTRAP